MLLGIAGAARAGKTTAAEFIDDWAVNNYGIHVSMRPLAGQLKEAVAALLNLPVGKIDELKLDPSAHVQTFTVHGQLSTLSMRQVLQRMGTEVGRDIFGEDFWCNLALPQGTGKNPEDHYYDNAHRIFLVPDIRYKNEIEYIKRLGGKIIRIDRADQEGLESGATHSSEAGIPDDLVDAVVTNPGTSLEGGLMKFRHNVLSAFCTLFEKELDVHNPPEEGDE